MKILDETLEVAGDILNFFHAADMLACPTATMATETMATAPYYLLPITAQCTHSYAAG